MYGSDTSFHGNSMLMLTKAFRIDADDTSTGALPAMSRPPSRVGRDVLDLTNEHAQASASVNKTPQERDEDADLQAAIKMSLGQEIPGQENGVTGTGQQFGPATQANYDPAKWSMMPIATSREIVDHPPPSKRRRIEGQPAFLRGSKETRYLGALLTIYHSIPLAREALLLPALEVGSYGYDPSWWSGSTDENQKSLAFQTNEQSDAHRVNLLAEVQCLMVFLDGTKRAYGSVDALADLYAMRTFRSESPFSRFLEAWRAAAIDECPQEQLTQIFSSVAMKSMNPEAEPISKDLVCLEPQVNRIEGQLLVDLMDTTVWNDNAENLDDVWISHCAEVFTIHMYDPGQKDEGLYLTTSPLWFPDRYMEHCRDITREMRHEMQLIRKDINKYTALQWKCQFLPGPDGKRISVWEVLDTTSKSSSVALEDRVPNDRPDDELPEVDVEGLQPEVKALLDRIDQKLDALEETKLELQAQMLKIARTLTQPSEEQSLQPFNKYVLQGVSTKPDIVYVRQRNPDLLGLDDEDSSSREEWQWWRMSWSHNKAAESIHPPMIGPLTQEQVEAAKNANDGWGSEEDRPPPYSVIKVSEKDVIEAAKTEHNSVVLVYANENAMNFQGAPLSQGLAAFVKHDNVFFERECKEEVSQPVWGSEETFEDVPLDDGQNARFPAREMTPMSMGSPHRDEDGQPSPKRPKSSEEGWKQEEHPPSYDESVGQPEMQERPKNKIGIYADQLLERYGNGTQTDGQDTDKGPVHIEHSMELPR